MNTIYQDMPEWWKRYAHLKALRRPLTDAEWEEFCSLDNPDNWDEFGMPKEEICLNGN
jgi:hypothetical protein